MFVVNFMYLSNSANTMFLDSQVFDTFNLAKHFYDEMLEDFVNSQKRSYIITLSEISCSRSEFEEMSDEDFEKWSNLLEYASKIEGDD